MDYYDDGKIASVICYNAQKQRNGEYKEYHDNGVMTYHASYVRDSLDGMVTRFHFNGKVFYKIDYKMNRLWNIVNMLDANGNVLDCGSLVDGNGLLKMYSPGGHLRSFGTYSNGLKDGYWKIVANSGVVDSILYSKGRKNGNGKLEPLP